MRGGQEASLRSSDAECFSASSQAPARSSSNYHHRTSKQRLVSAGPRCRLATIRGITLEHEVARHNVAIMEQQRGWAAEGRPLPCASGEERIARFKAPRKRGVDKAREKRRAARLNNARQLDSALASKGSS